MKDLTLTKDAARSTVVDRKRLLVCLERIKAVVSRRTYKPILGCVRLETQNGTLCLAATDGEVTLATHMPVTGTLNPCVVPAADLLRRVRAARDATCTLALRPKSSKLTLTTGAVAHVLATLPAEDFPPVPDRHQGTRLDVAAHELHQQLRAVSRAMATDSSRYAIQGTLLECDEHGQRLVTTDGRRLAVAELRDASTPFRGRVILPNRLVTVAGKLADADSDDAVLIRIDRPAASDDVTPPDTLYVAAEDWLVSATALEGSFPQYQAVIPASQSRFQVDRGALLDALREVAPTAAAHQPTVTVRLAPRRIELSVESPDVGCSTARVATRFLGGGDERILTAIRPQYFADVLRSLRGEQVIIDAKQNELTTDGKVCGFALSFRGEDPSVRWVVMPITLDLPPSRETLGRNFIEQAA